MSIRGVSAYSQVQAIVRARYATLLKGNEWSSLAATHDFDALLSLLSKSAYGPYLDLPGASLTARRTVYQLRWRLASDYDRVIDVSPSSGRQVVVTLWQSFEVDNLKAALRGAENGASWDQVRHMLSPMTKNITLTMADMERMVRSGGVARAIERVAHTPYYGTLAHALDRYEAEHNLFPLEVALDLDHRRSLWSSVQRLRGADYRGAMRLVGTMLDNENLLWALRYRIYHHLSEQEIVNYTLPLGYELRDEDIRGIARGVDALQVIHRLYPELETLTPLPDLSTGGLSVLEHHLQTRLMGLCRATFGGSPFHIGLVIAYLLLRENEIRNLTTLIEAKASQLGPEAFEPIMVN